MADTFTLIAGQRRAIADVLESLDTAQWNAPSLCEGWTVREVAAHLAMPFNVNMAGFMWRMLKAGGDFDKVSDDYARRAFVPEARVAGLRFVATDVDFATGDGPIVEGPGQSLALALAGRPALVGDLSGDGVATLTRRIN